MNIYIANKKTKIENIQKKYPTAVILDVTSTSKYQAAQKLSPFYPHGNIPIPFTDNIKATCVEAVWQGLKVFEGADVDFSTFRNMTMKNIKRTVRKYGKPLGHRKGAYGKDLLNYFDARMLIYLPTYKWVLDNIPEVHKTIEKIKEKLKEQDIVFLDYNTNTNYTNMSKPLSHAGLIKLYIENKYPDINDIYKNNQTHDVITLENIKSAWKTILPKIKDKKQISVIENVITTINNNPNNFLSLLNKNGISKKTKPYKEFKNILYTPKVQQQTIDF